MKLTPEERAERRAAFRGMTVPEKLEYIFAYYKLPLVLLLIAAIVLGSVLTRLITRKNELLYLGFINVSAGETLQASLTDGYVDAVGADPRKNEVYVYAGLYVSDAPAEENHEYAYASKLKVFASVNAKQMDVVLLNREAYDIFSHSGYLAELTGLLQSEDPALISQAEAYFSENEIILEDNAIEMQLGTADTYEAVTAASVNGLEISGAPFFRDAGFHEPVYLCVIANTPRPSEAAAYIRYILSDEGNNGRR